MNQADSYNESQRNNITNDFAAFSGIGITIRTVLGT